MRTPGDPSAAELGAPSGLTEARDPAGLDAPLFVTANFVLLGAAPATLTLRRSDADGNPTGLMLVTVPACELRQASLEGATLVLRGTFGPEPLLVRAESAPEAAQLAAIAGELERRYFLKAPPELGGLAEPGGEQRILAATALAEHAAHYPRVVDALIGRLMVEPEMLVVQRLVGALATIRGLHGARVSRVLVALLSHAIGVESSEQALPRYRSASGAVAELPSDDLRAKRWPIERGFSPLEQVIAAVAARRDPPAIPWLRLLSRCRAPAIARAARVALLGFDTVPAQRATLASELRGIADDARRDGDASTARWAIEALGAAAAARGMHAQWFATRLDDGDAASAVAAALAIAAILERDRAHVATEVIDRLVERARAPADPPLQSALWLALERAGHPVVLPAHTERLARAIRVAIAVPGALAHPVCAVSGAVIYAAGTAAAAALRNRRYGMLRIDLATHAAELEPLPFDVPAADQRMASSFELVAAPRAGPVYLLVANGLQQLCAWDIASCQWLARAPHAAPGPLTADSFVRDRASVIGDAAVQVWVRATGELAVVLDGHVGHADGDDAIDSPASVLPPVIREAREAAEHYRSTLTTAMVDVLEVAPALWQLPWATYFDPGPAVRPRAALQWQHDGRCWRVLVTESSATGLPVTTALVLATADLLPG